MRGRRLRSAILGGLLAASCGGGAAPGAVASGGGATGAAATSAAAASTAPTNAATPQPSAAAGPALAAILGTAKLTEYKVTYKLTATGSGAAMSGEQTWYLKPPRSRFDFTSAMGGHATTMSIFDLPEGSFMCFGDVGQTQCLGTPASGSPAQQNLALSFQESLVDHPNDWGGVLVETRTIAGQKAYCYDVRALAAAAAGLSEGRFCWSDKGMLLLQSFKSGDGTWSMEATNVSTSVPASDFTLPAQPMKMP